MLLCSVHFSFIIYTVEEWTNDETGVGAIIAISNQVEKEIWALFVKAINNKNLL